MSCLTSTSNSDDFYPDALLVMQYKVVFPVVSEAEQFSWSGCIVLSWPAGTGLLCGQGPLLPEGGLKGSIPARGPGSLTHPSDEPRAFGERKDSGGQGLGLSRSKYKAGFVVAHDFPGASLVGDDYRQA